MKINHISQTVCLLILLTLPCCDKPIEEEEKPQMPEKYDIAGTWSLVAWFPLDSPEGLEYRYDITRGDLIFDGNEYGLNLHYTFYNQADSLIEMGTFYYSSEYFVSWEGEYTLFWGYIDFYPLNGEFWTVRWRTGYPPDQYNQIIFRNFMLKNDTTMVMLYWFR
jgi:hypothetical protein